MNYKELSEKQQLMKQNQRASDSALIRNKEASPAEIASRNSCFSGVDLRACRSRKGFDLF